MDMLSARKVRPVVSSQRPTSALPRPQRLPDLAGSAEGVGPDETTAVVETPAMAPRKTPAPMATPISSIRALTSRRPPPPLPARSAPAAPALETKADAAAPSSPPAPAGLTAEAFGESSSSSEHAAVVAPVFPVAPATRAVQLVVAAGFFYLYVLTAIVRWMRHVVPLVAARAVAGSKVLLVEGRRRVRLEWLRAAARATEPRLRRD